MDAIYINSVGFDAIFSKTAYVILDTNLFHKYYLAYLENGFQYQINHTIDLYRSVSSAYDWRRVLNSQKENVREEVIQSVEYPGYPGK